MNEIDKTGFICYKIIIIIKKVKVSTVLKCLRDIIKDAEIL